MITVIDWTPLKGQMLPSIGIWGFSVVPSIDLPFCNLIVTNSFATF